MHPTNDITVLTIFCNIFFRNLFCLKCKFAFSKLAYKGDILLLPMTYLKKYFPMSLFLNGSHVKGRVDGPRAHVPLLPPPTLSPSVLRMKESGTNLGTTVFHTLPPDWSQWYLDTWVPEWRTDLVEHADHDQQLLAAQSSANPHHLV